MLENEISTYIGYKGYTIIKKYMSIEEQEFLRNDLTVKPFVPKNSIVKPPSFRVYRESKNKFYIPKFYGLENYGDPDTIKTYKGKSIDLKFNGELREKQKPVVAKFLKNIKTRKSGLLALHTGFGKTCLGLYIISALKMKTIIVVHKEFLLRQWVERIEQFLPDAKVGRIQAKIMDVEDKDIVICMLQSLSMKDYPPEIFRDFGFAIYDEVHHLGAEVFSRAFYKLTTEYSLGLSATMKRKDGLSKLLNWFLGNVVCKIERKGEDNVLVKVIRYHFDDDDFNKLELDYRGRIKYTTMIKKLCEFDRRSEFILKVISDLFKQNIDQQIIVLAHQKKLLGYLHDAIKDRNIATVGYYVGGMKEKDLKISEGKQVIIATYAMAEEGLDIKTLTTLVMATPKVDVTQSVGRILRQKRKESLVVDIVDSHMIFERHFKKRKTFYRKQKFKIIEANMEQYENGEWTTIYDGTLTKKSKSSKNASKNIKIKTEKYTTKSKDALLTGMCLISDDDE